MTKTLITDGFEDDEVKEVRSLDAPVAADPHNIVYGVNRHTDALDDETIALLVEVGVIVWDRTVSGPGWETRIYVSRAGVLPA
jgi:hypothetical protein